MTLANGEIRYGKAIVRQSRGSTNIDVVGEVRSALTPPSVTFSTLDGIVQDDLNKVLFVYRNDRDEMGLAIGSVTEVAPKSFFVRYYDVQESDTNWDFGGRIDFKRSAFPEQTAFRDQDPETWWLGPTPKPEPEAEPLASELVRDYQALWDHTENSSSRVLKRLASGGVTPLEFRSVWNQYKSAESEFRNEIESNHQFFTPQN